MKRIIKSKLDKFYTKEEVSKYLISKIDLSLYELIIEPSCGNGSFYNNIEHSNKIGIDIEPEIENVLKMDFFDFKYNSSISRDKILIIGNPPFGKQGSLAMDFINHSSLYSDTIAFILPLSFVKISVKNRIPNYYHLEYEEILPENSFLLNNGDYDVKCVFQIWKRKDHKRIKIKSDKEIGFKYVKEDENPDLSIRRVGVYAGKCFYELNKSSSSHYFIKIDDKSKVVKVFKFLNNYKWEDYTVGPRSISKYELNKVINDILK